MNIKQTASIFITFAIKRLAETFGLIVFFSGLLLLISLISYSPNDPNFIFPENTEIKNILGFRGSIVSDLLFQSIGLASYLLSLTLIITGINILRIKDLFLVIENLFFSVLYLISGTLFLSYFYKNAFALYINGNGGFVGVYLNQTFLINIIQINEVIFFYVLIILILVLFLISINFKPFGFYLSVKNFLKFFKKNSNLIIQIKVKLLMSIFLKTKLKILFKRIYHLLKQKIKLVILLNLNYQI